MLPALDAILGQRSAHSFDTGPVMADPFISPWKWKVKFKKQICRGYS